MAKVHTDTNCWLAPAKINRFLHITGQRKDGYHELQTVFQFLNYADELFFTVLPHNEISHRNPISGVVPENDLTIRAARLLQKSTQCSLGVQISINKYLPMGGGLGGGSSDAATTLVALNTLWNLHLSTQELADLGMKLGADVPIFVHGFSAWAEGIGEQLIPIELDEPWFVVLIPSVSVATADIFASSLLKRDCRPLSINDFKSGKGINVCEDIACQMHPEIAFNIKWLSQYAPARMTGTGACVFAMVESEVKAKEILQKKEKSMNGFFAKGCNKSPMYSIC